MGHNVVIAYLWVVASMGVALNLLNAIVIWLQMKQLKENIKDHTVIYVSIKVRVVRGLCLTFEMDLGSNPWSGMNLQ